MRNCKRLLLPGAVLLLAGLAACRQQGTPADYVVRLNDQYLTTAELRAALQTLPGSQDATVAREQIVEQWVTHALLFEEAQRRGLRNDPEVQRLLEESERSVLVSALLNQLYEEPAAPTPPEVRAYYERHKDLLRLREPYVRVRSLTSLQADSAAAARVLLQHATSAAHADSLWPALAARFALDPDQAQALANNFYPESRLFTSQPDLRAALAALGPRETAPLIKVDSLFYLVQLVERIPAGTVPELPWVEEEVRQRLAIQGRKQIYARQVQRLRNEALSREALEIR